MYLGGVSVAYEKERTPPEWSVVPKTVNGHDADLNAGTKLPLLGGAKMYICVRPLNHQDSHYITNVTVIHEGKEAVPLGHEVVRRSVSGKDANLNAKSGGSKLYLCVKREPRYTAGRALSDLCIIRPKHKEACPPGYELCNKNVNEKSPFGEPVYLGFRYVQSPTAHMPAPAPPQQQQQMPTTTAAPSSVRFGVPFGANTGSSSSGGGASYYWQQQQQQQQPPPFNESVNVQAPTGAGDVSQRVMGGRDRTGAVGRTHPSNPAQRGPGALLSGVSIRLAKRYQELAALSSMSTLTISGDASFVDVDQKYAYSFERELRIKAG